MLNLGFENQTANVRGSLWMLTAGILFSIMMASVKFLGGRLPSVEIVFFRSFAQLVILFPIFWKMGFSVLRTKRPGLQGIRAIVAVVLINCNFYAITQLPLVDATAISFSRALFVTVLAIIFLNEQVGKHRWAATLIGFAGILIILRPGQTGLDPAMLIALIGAALGASMTIMVRKLSAFDPNTVLMAFPAFAVVIFTAIPAAIYWVMPTPFEFLILAAMGSIGVLAQWCFIQSFRVGEASAIAPVGYVRLIFASIIGFWLFAEIPDAMTFVGAGVIVAGALYTVVRESRHRKPTKLRTPGDLP